MATAKAKAPAVPSPKQEGTASDFVYAGRRLSSEDKLVVKLFLLSSDGTLGEERVYKYSTRMVLGGIYSGSRFSETAAHGLNLAKWTGKYFAGSTNRLKWEAEEMESLVEYKTRRREADATAKSELHELTRPLRRVLQQMRDRGDWAGVESFTAAVTLSLRRGLTPGERQ